MFNFDVFQVIVVVVVFQFLDFSGVFVEDVQVGENDVVFDLVWVFDVNVVWVSVY